MRRRGGFFESICSFPFLVTAAQRAARGKRDRPRVARFMWDLEPEIVQLEEDLRSATYRPRRPDTFWIHDPKRRLISVADFRDRVVHHALCAQVGPILEARASGASFACRVGMGPERALQKAQSLARSNLFFLKCDIRGFFASIDHHVLKTLLRRVIKDARALRLMDVIIDHGAASGDAGSGRGLPIGNLTSQHFANFYLTGFDQWVEGSLRPSGYVRYMDDVLLFAHERALLKSMLRALREELAAGRKLALKDSATLLTRTAVGVPYLGVRTFPGTRRLSRRKLRRFRDQVRKRRSQLAQELALSGDGAMPGDAALAGDGDTGADAHADANANADARYQARMMALCEHVSRSSGPALRRRILGHSCEGSE